MWYLLVSVVLLFEGKQAHGEEWCGEIVLEELEEEPFLLSGTWQEEWTVGWEIQERSRAGPVSSCLHPAESS